MSHSPMELAAAYIRAGELADALDALNEHLTNDPGDDDARRTRVEVRLRLGGERHWTAALDELAALSETTAADHYTRSVLLERLGRLDEAQSAARAAVDVAADEAFRGKAVDRLLDLAHKRGDADGALRVALENDWAGRAGDAALALDDAQAAYDHYTEALMRTEKLRWKCVR
jgi:tetratricopeptide (TPR) repeat protein